jgi:hypothetical protein
MSGTDKRELLVTGKGAKPRCFKGFSVDSLPVLYYAKNWWMISKIFIKWLLSWGVELQRKSSKLLQVLDSCAARPHLESLKNIQLEFLSPNTTSVVQPTDMGIMKNLKTLYRAKSVNYTYILEAIQENLLTSSSATEEVSARIDLFLAVQLISDSWQRVSIENIQNCFARSDFKNADFEMLNRAESDIGSAPRRKLRVLCIDNSLQ